MGLEQVRFINEPSIYPEIVLQGRIKFCKIIVIASTFSILSFHGRDLSTQLDFYSSPLLGTDFLGENCNNTLQPAI